MFSAQVQSSSFFMDHFFYFSSKKGLISLVQEFYCLDFSMSSSWVLQLLFMPYDFWIFISIFDGPNSQQAKHNFRELKSLVDACSTTSCSDSVFDNLIHMGWLNHHNRLHIPGAYQCLQPRSHVSMVQSYDTIIAQRASIHALGCPVCCFVLDERIALET
jgi:hypothetical protein